VDLCLASQYSEIRGLLTSIRRRISLGKPDDGLFFADRIWRQNQVLCGCDGQIDRQTQTRHLDDEDGWIERPHTEGRRQGCRGAQQPRAELGKGATAHQPAPARPPHPPVVVPSSSPAAVSHAEREPWAYCTGHAKPARWLLV
jgi:hypothetical protein